MDCPLIFSLIFPSHQGDVAKVVFISSQRLRGNYCNGKIHQQPQVCGSLLVRRVAACLAGSEEQMTVLFIHHRKVDVSHICWCSCLLCHCVRLGVQGCALIQAGQTACHQLLNEFLATPQAVLEKAGNQNVRQF